MKINRFINHHVLPLITVSGGGLAGQVLANADDLNGEQALIAFPDCAAKKLEIRWTLADGGLKMLWVAR